MKFAQLIALVTAGSMLVACSQPMGRAGGGITQGGGSINKQDVGTLAGAIGGGIIGSNIGSGKGAIAGTIAGTLLGGALGSSIGASLDKADMVMYDQTSQRALNNSQNGQTLPWKNPQTGNSGTITPTNYFKNDAGEYCREYTQTIVIGGKREQGRGTACREPDGTWRIVE
ncbi:MAG: glycine zipper 2TM domain-containing protein [Rickettsiales bacterium]|jgi:surface antigen|nr:glycine zipper 2TM domain-containing protein [Rickettsiales bacterium]